MCIYMYKYMTRDQIMKYFFFFSFLEAIPEADSFKKEKSFFSVIGVGWKLRDWTYIPLNFRGMV